LTAPKGGEVWSAGSVRNITWTGSGVATVNIGYSKDMGTTWLPITTNVDGATGSYSWTLPAEQIPACLLMISDSSNPSVFSKSGNVFSVVNSFITLTAPNGGESIKAKSMVNITWTSPGVDTVNIELSTNGGTSWVPVVSNVTGSTGSYLWQVPETLSQNCLIRISDAGNAALNDRSNAAFGITSASPRSITLLSPNGGEKVEFETYYSIRWSATFTDVITIEISFSDGTNWSRITQVSAASGSFNWLVPRPAGATCRVRVIDTVDPTVSDTSDASFSIIPRVRSYTVTTPNGGEQLTGGSTENITWTSSLADTVRIEFSPDGGSTWQALNAKYSGVRSFSWKVPDVSSSNCLVRISYYLDPQVQDESNSPFTVIRSTPVAPTITLTAPNGGESWAAGSPQNITWSYSNVSGTGVHLEYSSDGATTWQRIASNQSLYSRSFAWRVPSIQSSACLVRVVSADIAGLSDRSNAPFSITGSGASITLMRPKSYSNDSVTLIPGETTDIVWTSFGVSRVKIEYQPVGQSWSTIVDDVAASAGKYAWTVPNLNTIITLKVSDTGNAQISSESTGLTVSPSPSPSLALTAPLGGDRWAVGSTHAITWNSTGVDKVDLYYEFYSGAGATLTRFATDVDARSGSYAWTVPNIVGGSARIKIMSSRLVSGVSGVAANFSNYFSVPQVQLYTPNGGESLVLGSDYRITWNNNSGVSKVKLDFSTDNGASWNPIASNLWADSKFYDWKAPFARSTQCLVRITDMDTPDCKDQSDAVFSAVNSLKATLPLNMKWTEGNTENITWTSVGVDRLKIEFSKDLGATWIEIAPSVDASLGSYAWTLPSIASDFCKVRLTDTHYSPVSAESYVFSIKLHGTLQLASPNGGERFSPGQHITVQWTGTNVLKLRIDLSTDGGSTWTVLLSNLPGNLTNMQVDLPQNVSSTNCLMRIADEHDDFGFDVSNAPFTIRALAAREAPPKP
ncbi:MAG: GPI anchored serine-threonine rich family protein, partial [Candidatus Latescibacterota bacterium]